MFRMRAGEPSHQEYNAALFEFERDCHNKHVMKHVAAKQHGFKQEANPTHIRFDEDEDEEMGVETNDAATVEEVVETTSEETVTVKDEMEVEAEAEQEQEEQE